MPEPARILRLDPLVPSPLWSRWDSFVAAHPRGAFPQLHGHLAALAEVTSYRIEAALLLGPEVRGVLAWCRPRWSRTAVSLPFYEYGGPLFAAKVSPREVASLLAAAGPLELRMAHGWDGPDVELERRVLYPFATLPLAPDPEAVLAGTDRQVRKALRKSARAGLVVRQANDAWALRDEFYPAYLRWMRERHGTPPLPYRYWAAVQRRLRGHWRLFQAWHEGRLVAQLLGFAVGQRVVITTIVSDELAWDLRPNDAVHWAFIDWACRRGYRWFDFGAARYEGQRRYKEKWGCQFGVYEQLGWDACLGAHEADPDAGPARALRALWARLPLAVTEVAGLPVREWLTR